MDNALRKLKQNDSVLLEINVNERTISHKLAEYLQNEFSSFFVDCEYNRHSESVKILNVPKDPINWDDMESKTIFPDIVIHKRTTDKENLLIIEIKKSSNRINHKFDESKIKALMMEPYNYKFGLFLEINVDGRNNSLEWYTKDE